jgi:hypothetical protein
MAVGSALPVSIKFTHNTIRKYSTTIFWCGYCGNYLIHSWHSPVTNRNRYCFNVKKCYSQLQYFCFLSLIHQARSWLSISGLALQKECNRGRAAKFRWLKTWRLLVPSVPKNLTAYDYEPQVLIFYGRCSTVYHVSQPFKMEIKRLLQ